MVESGKTIAMTQEDTTPNPASYNPILDRMGYFCEVCGHEANGPNGLELFEHVESGTAVYLCRSECVPEELI
jgi:hypothetical protein